jgi:hypothetical protein
MSAKKIIYAELDEKEGVVLHLDTKNYYRLNETGQFVWKRLSDGMSPEQVASELTQTYEVALDEARRDVEAICQKMTAEQLWEGTAPSTSTFSVKDAHDSKAGKQI